MNQDDHSEQSTREIRTSVEWRASAIEAQAESGRRAGNGLQHGGAYRCLVRMRADLQNLFGSPTNDEKLVYEVGHRDTFGLPLRTRGLRSARGR